MVIHSIDHNELGVAFEWMTSVLVEARVPVHPAAREALAVAASEMHLEDNADWRTLSQ